MLDVAERCFVRIAE
jgi:hypothetical protein